LDVLFLHPNFPGQFRQLARALSQDPEHRVWSLSDAQWASAANEMPNVKSLHYPSVPNQDSDGAHPWAKPFDKAVRTGDAALRALAAHKREGLEPDVVITHPGWGDAFFVRDLFPGVKVIGLFEYFYRARGADVGFDHEFPGSLNDIFRLHAGNATQLLALESCDIGICATQWQRSRYPNAYQPMLEVLHEGVDTTLVRPNPSASFQVPGGPLLTCGDEVLTYVSRHLEPYRGFHVFMRALPAILAQRPHLQVLVVGESEGTSYGPPPRNGGHWKDEMLRELGGQLDLNRVHFLGKLPFDDYLKVLQVSAVHLYLTYPFILSWSLLEAMAAGCLLVASDTAPVREVIDHEEQGLLFGFHNPDELVSTVARALDDRESLSSLKELARQRVIERFDFSTVTLPRYLELMAH
jgi:glycosyltransferase involved in cell wall biosynthesis